MRRSTSSVAPRSGSSTTSAVSVRTNETNSGSRNGIRGRPNAGGKAFKRRRRRRQPGKSVAVAIIRVLLLVVVVLTGLDFFLWRRNRTGGHATSSPGLGNSVRAANEIMSRKVGMPPPTGTDKHDGEDVDFGKDQIYHILAQANVHKEDLDYETRRRLPTWSTIERLFGDSPRIYGLDTCQRFRDSVDPTLKFYGIAGTFNSGTNLLAELLIQNCQITERMEVYGDRQKGMRWQVPWGKHTPAKLRESHVTQTDRDVPLENSLPMIAIRDPFVWLQSMCRHPYEAIWSHSDEHCPAIMVDGELTSVRVNYRHTQTRHDSLPHMWNEWYQEYMQVDYPRIIVRFEDLLFYGQNVTETLCECGGGVPRRPSFRHIVRSAKLGTKQHGSDKTGLVEALIRYGTDEGRLKGLSRDEIRTANDIFDDDLMKIFNYFYAEVPGKEV